VPQQEQRPQLVAAFDGLAVACTGDVLFALWQKPATWARFDELEQQMEAMARDHETFIVCQLILSSSTPPNAALRARLRVVMRRFEGRMRYLISVPLGDAIWMGIVRVIMRGLAIISGHAATSSVSATAEEALERVAWAAGGRTPDREALVAAVLAACSELGVTRAEVGL